jgi:dTMP kinase
MTTERRGYFVSFEGGDGAGKSTQIGRLADYLRARGKTVRVTREPGGTVNAEAIRALMVEGQAERWSALAEALLMYAARADHLERVIRPALARGEVVITDRFADSTMAYQGIAGGLGESVIGPLHQAVVGSDDPDLTLILDLSPEVGLRRARGRGVAGTRFESKGGAFQESVRSAFLKIARDNPDRCVVIDAAADEASVAATIAKVIGERLLSR